MTNIEIAVARDQIRHLVACYNTSADRGRVEEVALLFAPDGILELTNERLEGRAAITAMFAGITRADRPTADLAGSRHQLTTTRIELVDAGEARGWLYFFVSRRGTIIEEGTYIDRYVRLPGGWRIAHRRVKMLYSINHED